MLTLPSPSRRWFLRGLVATAVAPAIVRADSLMRIVPREVAFVIVPGPHWVDPVLYNIGSLLSAQDGDYVVYRGGPWGDKRYRIQRPPVRPGVRSMIFHPA